MADTPALRHPVPLDGRLMLYLLRFLNRGRCYHCDSGEQPTKRNRLGLRYCADFGACEARMRACLKSDVTGLREVMEEVPGGA